MCIQNASIVPREFRFDYGFKWMVEQDGELYLPFLNFSGRRNRYNKEYKSIPKEYSTYSHFFKKALEAFD